MPMSPEARALIEAERRRHGSGAARPSQEARDRVKRRVFSAVGVGIGSLSAASTGIAGTAVATGTASAPAAGVTTGIAAVTNVGLGAKAIGILALAVIGTGIVGGGIYVARSKEGAEAPSASATSAPSASPVAASTHEAPTRNGEPEARPGPTASEPKTAAPSATAADPIAAAVAAASAARPGPSGAGRPRERPVESAAATEDDLGSETALLAKAQGALGAGRYDEALATTSEHARRFPKGSLSTERQAIRAIALCSTGHKSEGRAAAGSLLERTGTPLGDRIATACR